MADEIVGILKVIANLHHYQDEMLIQLEDALMGATQDAKEFADQITPVLTGYLKSRNQVREGPYSPTEISAEYYNDAPYALYVEYGTVHMRAQPFMTPAMEWGRKRLWQRLQQLAI